MCLRLSFEWKVSSFWAYLKTEDLSKARETTKCDSLSPWLVPYISITKFVLVSVSFHFSRFLKKILELQEEVWTPGSEFPRFKKILYTISWTTWNLKLCEAWFHIHLFLWLHAYDLIISGFFESLELTSSSQALGKTECKETWEEILRGIFVNSRVPSHSVQVERLESAGCRRWGEECESILV